MSNEIIKNTKIPTNATQQTGENNVMVQNQDGGTVNINYNITTPTPQLYSGNSAEQIAAIYSFSTDYYQLIVTADEKAFETNIITIPTNRALTKDRVPKEIYERCSELSESGIAELKKMPAIVCVENTKLKGETDPSQLAMYSYIKEVRVRSKEVKIMFCPIAPIQQQLFCNPKNAFYFDLNMECAITDLNQTAWSVRKVNVFKAFKQAGIKDIPMPN